MKRLCLILLCLLLLCGCTAYKRVTYGDIRQQSTDPAQAVADGCVVIGDGVIENVENLVTFFEQCAAKKPAQLRILNQHGRLQDLSYDGDHYTLQTLQGERGLMTQRYHYLNISPEDALRLSVCSNPELLQSHYGIDASMLDQTLGSADLLALLDAKTAQHVRYLVGRSGGSELHFKTWSENGEYRCELSASVEGPTTYRLSSGKASSGGSSGTSSFGATSVPVCLLPMRGNSIGVLYLEEDDSWRLATEGSGSQTYYGNPATLLSQLAADGLERPNSKFLTEAPALIIVARNKSYVAGCGTQSISYQHANGRGMMETDADVPSQWDDLTEVPVGRLVFRFSPSVEAAAQKVWFTPDSDSEARLELSPPYQIDEPGIVEVWARFTHGTPTDTEHYDITASYGFRVVE